MRHIISTFVGIRSVFVRGGEPKTILFHTVHFLGVAGQIVGMEGHDGLVQPFQILLQFV